PEPHGQNCQMIYTEMDAPLVEIGLYPDRDLMQILNRAAAKIDTKLLGYVPRDVMAQRRRIALGAVTGGFIIILGAILYMLRRLASAVSPESGARPAGSSTLRYHAAPWLFMAPAVLSIAVWAY